MGIANSVTPGQTITFDRSHPIWVDAANLRFPKYFEQIMFCLSDITIKLTSSTIYCASSPMKLFTEP